MSSNGKVNTWAEVYQKFEGRCEWLGIKESTMEQYGRTIGRFCQWGDGEGIVPASIEPEQVSGYLEGLKRDDGESYSQGRKRAYARSVKTLLNYACDEKIIPERIKIRMPKAKKEEVKSLNPEQLEKVIDYFEGRAAGNPRDTAIVHLLLDTGLRAAELLALKWDDLIWDEEKQQGSIHVKKQYTRNREYKPLKNDKPRTVYFRARAWRYLLANKADLSGQVDFHNRGPWHAFAVNTDTGPVFWGWPQVDKPDVLGASGLAYMLKTAGKELGIPLTPHVFRHTCGRLMTVANVPPMAIKAILGHSSLAMVEHYSRLWGADVENLYYERMNGNGSG